jgi:hypothetical protein
MDTLFDRLKSLTIKILSPPFHESIRSAPDSLFLGSILLSIFTQSFPLIVLSLAMAEFGILHRVLANLLDFVSDNLKTQSPEICRMGLPSPYQISAIGQLLKEYAFPNGTLFFLAAVIVYINSGIFAFKQELTEISSKGDQYDYAWGSRVTMSVIFSGLLMILFLLYNVYYGCVNILPAFGSVGIGSVIGLCIFLLHSNLFGKNAVNFLGIPNLEKKNEIIGTTK